MSEVRLIDANAYAAEMKERQDALKEMIDAAVKDDNWELYDKLSRSFGVFVEAKLTLDKMPTVDAVPVRHGHWEIVPNDHNTDSYYKMRCSVCGGTLWGIQSEELFCCKCGAKMDGADGERR